MNRILPKQIMFLTIFLVLFTSIRAEVFPVEIIKYSGPPDQFMNMVIMGDGYTLSEQSKFMTDAQFAINGFFAQEPFKPYKDSINVFAIKVVSNVSGASLNPDALIDNYFGSSYWSYGLERLLVAWRVNKVNAVLNSNTPFYDEAVIMVNDSKYGGSGGQFAVFSTHNQAIELLLHEFGHSFSDLADEYWAGIQYAAEKRNMTQDNNPATVKWKDFLNINGVGIFPYDESPSWYRPHQNCKMRFLGPAFCDVCHSAMTNDIISLINHEFTGAPVAYFTANKLEVPGGNTISFFDFSSNKPDQWEWTFEGGTPSSSTEQNPVITYNTAGTYSVSLLAKNGQGNNTLARNGYINVIGSVDVPSIDYSTSVSIYPNPAGDYLQVSYDYKFTPTYYRIFNSVGMNVKKGDLTDAIDISDLPKGVYVIWLETGNASISKKLIKN